MKILTRYILNEFIKPFFISALAFSVLVLIVQVFTDIHFIMEFKPGALLTLKYFFVQVPGFAVQTLPIAVLMAVLFSLSQLSKNSELIAMRAGGVSIFMVAIPLCVCGLIICLFTIFMNESVVPQTTRMIRHTKVVEIEKQPEQFANLQRQNFSGVSTSNQLYHIGSFNGANNTLTDILILGFDENIHLKSRMDAKSAQYVGDHWVFNQGYLRTFDDNDREISAQAFDKINFAIPEKPSDFLTDPKTPEELSLLELYKYVQQLEKNGSDSHKELVELNHKLAVPFGCIILAILGVSFGWSMGKYSGVVTSFGICLLVAFIYIGGQQIGQGIGNQGLLSPFLSMWSMNIIFSILGVFLLIRRNH
jgi:lipopolysaccharide export system permease protein